MFKELLFLAISLPDMKNRVKQNHIEGQCYTYSTLTRQVTEVILRDISL